MKTPRFTDAHRYPRGYTHGTDVAQTFRRERKRLADEAASRTAAEQAVVDEVAVKVRQMKKVSK